jgi:peptidoglycan/xylan/chitin deacetylase (PgdA/CDA1 family)
MTATDQFVLNFHGIGTPHEGVEAAERPYWIDESFFSRIVDLALARPDADRILWTFDDGNRSDLAVGARILSERGRTGQFFLLTGRLNDPRYLSPGDARSLLAMGMQIGLHGRDHVDWRHLASQQLDAETIAARQDLSTAIGAPIGGVAIPFGVYDRRVIAHLKRCGFDRIYTSDGGRSRPDQRICNRTSVRSDMTLERVAALIDDRVSLARKLRRTASTTARRYVLGSR